MSSSLGSLRITGYDTDLAVLSHMAQISLNWSENLWTAHLKCGAGSDTCPGARILEDFRQRFKEVPESARRMVTERIRDEACEPLERPNLSVWKLSSEAIPSNVNWAISTEKSKYGDKIAYCLEHFI